LVVGLTLGKYSPLHKGHESVFDLALSEVDYLIVVIYNSPETTKIPLQVRADWIRNIYPNIEVIEAWDGPTEIGNTDEIKKSHELYLLKILKGREISFFYTAEFYGDHVSKVLNAKWQKIDRDLIDISGTKIRQDPFNNRKYLNPYVYKDFVLNIAFLGAPSTGKTTICENLAKAFDTKWMPEYGREYWEINQISRRLSEDQLLEIATEHLKRENGLINQSNNFLFTDTNAITTYMFSKYYHNSVSNELESLAEKAEKRYDLIFLCNTDFPYDDTWDRSGDVNRIWFQQQIEADLKIRRIPYITISGLVESRLKQVSKIIQGIQKYDSIWNKLLEEKI
jgi:HTH-type transcriptional repressor of NAD biosynthesis genes